MQTDRASAQKNSFSPFLQLLSAAGRTPPVRFFRGVNALPRRFQKGVRFPAAVGSAGERIVVSGLDGVTAWSTAEVAVMLVVVVVGGAGDIFLCNSEARARRYPSARVRLDSATRWAWIWYVCSGAAVPKQTRGHTRVRQDEKKQPDKKQSASPGMTFSEVGRKAAVVRTTFTKKLVVDGDGRPCDIPPW